MKNWVWVVIAIVVVIAVLAGTGVIEGVLDFAPNVNRG